MEDASQASIDCAKSTIRNERHLMVTPVLLVDFSFFFALLDSALHQIKPNAPRHKNSYVILIEWQCVCAMRFFFFYFCFRELVTPAVHSAVTFFFFLLLCFNIRAMCHMFHWFIPIASARTLFFFVVVCCACFLYIVSMSFFISHFCCCCYCCAQKAPIWTLFSPVTHHFAHCVCVCCVELHLLLLLFRSAAFCDMQYECVACIV